MATSHNSGNSDILQKALEQVQDAVILTDFRGYLLYVNAATEKLIGCDKLDLLHRNIAEIKMKPSGRRWPYMVRKLRNETDLTLQIELERSDGKAIPVEINVSYLQLDDSEYVIGIARDYSDQHQQEKLNALQHRLSEMVFENEPDKLLRHGLDTAEKITQSRIGFFHFVENDEQNVVLQVWSTNTELTMCSSNQNGGHYPVADAGIWVECIPKRKAIIYNDYGSVANRNELPKGHPDLTRFVTVPLMRQGEVVAIMGVGQKPFDYDAKDVALLENIIEMIYSAFQRQQAEQKIGYMAYHDTLTELPNRHLLMESLNRFIARNKRSQEGFAVCYLDIDGFKEINDLYNHQLGDEVLQALAKRFTDTLREVDTVARLGGDEFVFVLSGIKSVAECELALKRLQQTVMLPFEIGGRRIHLTSYMGAMLSLMEDLNAEDFLRHAAQSAYTAKSTGKDFFHIYDPGLEQQSLNQQSLVKEFSRAILNDELRLYYQPKIDLLSLEVIGFEALIRWQHPNEGLLTPDKFLPALIDSVQELMLGEWVVEQAVKQLQLWQELGLNLSMSINISPKQIQRKAFSEFVLSVLENAPLGLAKYLEIELLEDSDVEDSNVVAQNMQALNAEGIKFLLDDFGTGYASLAHFYDLPFDVLKIDQNFVKQMLDRTDNLDIVEGVLRLSETIQRPVVAEGVESIEIAFMLMKMGCRFAQGYGIAKPMPAEAVEPWLQAWNGINLWQDLKNESDSSGQRYDLDVAIFSHRWWVHAIEVHLESSSREKLNGTIAPMPELNEARCQFFRWYRGIGLSRFSQQPGFAFLQGGHHELHELARAVYGCSSVGDYDQAWKIFQKLKRLSKELISTLQSMEPSGPG